MTDKKEENQGMNQSAHCVQNANDTPHQGDETRATAQENALPACGEKTSGGVGVSAPASSTRVAIYSDAHLENLQKNSTATGGEEKIGGALTPFGVESVIQRLWSSDLAVPREHAMASAAARLHDAARCFVFTGMMKTAENLCDLADLALHRAHEEKIARMNTEAKA